MIVKADDMLMIRVDEENIDEKTNPWAKATLLKARRAIAIPKRRNAIVIKNSVLISEKRTAFGCHGLSSRLTHRRTNFNTLAFKEPMNIHAAAQLATAC